MSDETKKPKKGHGSRKADGPLTVANKVFIKTLGLTGDPALAAKEARYIAPTELAQQKLVSRVLKREGAHEMLMAVIQEKYPDKAATLLGRLIEIAETADPRVALQAIKQFFELIGAYAAKKSAHINVEAQMKLPSEDD